MDIDKLRIVFLGTPDFAVASLEILVENGFNVVGVITTADKYGGRGGKQLLESPVKKYAVSKGLNILQPKNLKADSFLQELRELRADLQIVVAFRMLPVAVWDMPALGTFNLHGSLLPKYRGAAPINWAVMNGDKETGVTTFFLKHKIDTGNILFQEKMPILETDNVGDVHDKMMVLGASLVLKTATKLQNRETIVPFSQDESLVSHAPKIFSETCEIDFNKSMDSIYDFIRGLSPYPAAWTTLLGKKFKIYSSSKVTEEHVAIGAYKTDNKNYLYFGCSDGAISLKEVQLQGKKRMDIKSFLNGVTLE